MGTNRVCGMDEFRVEVVNIAQEAERQQQAAKAESSASTTKEEEEACVEGIPCHVQVHVCWWQEQR